MKNFTHALPILIFFTLFAGLGFSQQVSEGFEKQFFPPAAWKVVNVKGANTWKSAVENPRTGKKSAFIDKEEINNGVNGEGDNWLILPKVYNIQSGDKLNFFLAAQYTETYGPPEFENIEVYISTTDNQISSFTNLLTTIPLNNSFPTTYVPYSLNLPSYPGQYIYIAFRNHQNQGGGVYLDDVSVTNTLASDVGSQGINLNNDVIFPTGTTINIVDTVKNFGSSNLAAGIPVKYSINNGTPVVLNTPSIITPGAAQVMTFSGANAFTPNTPGNYTLKVYTDNPSEINRGNDTIIYTIKVRTPISAFPYFQDFTNLDDWTLAGSANFQFVDHITGALNEISNPAGDKNLAALAYTYNSYNEDFYLRSPVLNFSSVSKPLLNFYVAAGYFDNTYYDNLRVVVSTDGGVTYDALPLYYKSNTTSSKLVTVAPDKSFWYVPAAATDWRHEIVDLSKYAGNSNVIVAFKVTSGAGNNVWIDNVQIVDQNPALYTAARVSTAGQTVNGAYNTSVKFNSIVVADSVRIEGNNVTPPNWSNFDPNPSIPPPGGGAAETPDFVFARYFTIAYSGNSISRANYDISLDITGLSGTFDPDKLYILKRSDQTDAWTVLPTTRIGNILKSSGLTTFSDFAIGYNAAPVPVTVVSFSAHQVKQTVQLIWNTSQEINIANYEVQHWSGTEWKTLGNITSQKIAMQNQYAFVDNMPVQGLNLYRLRIVSEIGAITYSEIAKVQFANSENRVYQNVPNPFRDQTVIRLDLVKQSSVKVLVYNISGKQIAVLENGVKLPGSYLLKWNAGNIPVGTYFYKVIINDEVQTRRMLKIE